jgi:hypothetical protein
MAYARFSADSDVWVFQMVDESFICQACYLAPGVLGCTQKDTPKEMYLHLKDHIACGDKVPADAMRRLEEQIDGERDKPAASNEPSDDVPTLQ